MFPFDNFLETIYFIDGIEGLVLAIFSWYFVWHLPRQPYAMILQKQENVYVAVAKLILKSTDETRSFGENTYHIDWERCAYLSTHQKPVMLFVEGNTEPVSLAGVKFSEATNSGKLYMLAKKKVVQQLVEGSKQLVSGYANVLLMILIGALCFMIGIYVAPYINGGK